MRLCNTEYSVIRLWGGFLAGRSQGQEVEVAEQQDKSTGESYKVGLGTRFDILFLERFYILCILRLPSF